VKQYLSCQRRGTAGLQPAPSVSLAGGRAQAKEDTAELQERSKGLKQSIAAAEEESVRLERGRDATLAGIGNYVHDSVPVSADEVLRPARPSEDLRCSSVPCCPWPLRVLR